MNAEPLQNDELLGELPSGHVRVLVGPCPECSHVRPFAIEAGAPYEMGESHMHFIDFLDQMLWHCEDFHFDLTEGQRAEKQRLRVRFLDRKM